MPIPAGPLHAPAPSARSPIRRALAALTLTTAVVAAAACGSSKASTSRDSNAVEKPDLTVAVVPAISAAGLYVAQQRGYFTAAGLRVKILLVASGVDAIPNLASGSVDIDEGQWAADLSAEAAGAVRLYALAAASAGGPGVQEVVVPAGSPVTTVAQLRGKTIAVNALGGLAVLLTDNVLADHGVPVKDVHYVPVPFPAMGALAALVIQARQFQARAVAYAAQQGIGQFLDVGCGLPTAPNTHQTAQAITPDARVVYVDNDAQVLTHARNLLAQSTGVLACAGDLAYPAEILYDWRVRRFLNFHQPLCLILAMTMHFSPPITRKRSRPS